MNLASAPSKIVEAFAINGGKNTIPVASQIPITPGAASYNDGFPPLTRTAVNSGGIPPSGLDMNGILNEATAIDWWMSAGASFPFDSGFAAAVGGYPKGARVLNAARNGFWLSLIDANSNDPDAGGAGWMPSNAYALVYASAQQTLGTGNSKVIWDTVESDTHGIWNAGGHRFTAPWAGAYRLSGAVYLPAPGAQLLAVDVYKNGVIARRCGQFPQVSDGPLSYPFDAIVTLAIADYLETFMNVPSTAVLAGPNAGSVQPYVYGQIQFLGA